jgi:hypothetical protein
MEWTETDAFTFDPERIVQKVWTQEERLGL